LPQGAESVRNERCSNYIDGHIACVIAAKLEAKMQTLANTEIERYYSRFEQQVLHSSTDSHLKRLGRAAIEQTCQLDNQQQTVHLICIVDEMGSLGEKREAFIGSLKTGAK